jgi:hypothetical protein
VLELVEEALDQTSLAVDLDREGEAALWIERGGMFAQAPCSAARWRMALVS